MTRAETLGGQKKQGARKETEWGRALDRMEERYIQEFTVLRAQRRKNVACKRSKKLHKTETVMVESHAP